MYVKFSQLFCRNIMQLCTMTLAVLMVGALDFNSRVPKVIRTAFHGRIVGGIDTTIEKHPHQVSIEFNLASWQHSCGGSIIHKRWVLTAAHCAVVEAKDVRIRVGSTYAGRGGQLHHVSSLVVHEKFVRETLDYDVALLKVNKSFQFSKTVKKIVLRTKTPNAEAAVTATGWGSNGTAFPEQLQEVTLFVTSKLQCRRIFMEKSNGALKLTYSMMCAGVLEGGKDACQGDSGGPLIYKGRLAGIVSWGAKCGEKGVPGVYTDVARLRSWITSKSGVK